MKKAHARSARLLVLIGIAVLVTSSPRADERPYAFNSFDFPGATATRPSGINAAGDIVGQYVAAGQQRGFLLSGGIFTTIDFPTEDSTNPVSATNARGIGPGGDIVGTYRLAKEVVAPAHGFLLTRDGTFSHVDYPGHMNTIAQRILPNGTILGCYHDGNTTDSMHSMIAGRYGFTEFDMAMTMHNGATPNGKKIAGLWTDTNKVSHGYILEEDNFAPFDVPNSISTQAWDMNPAADIVGFYQDAATKRVHGFVVDVDWQFTTIDVPGAAATQAFGINSRGDIVGFYTNATGTHGFLASRTQGHDR